jgi:hypothetical protein
MEHLEIITIIAVLGTILAVYTQVRETDAREQALKKDIWDSRIGRIEKELSQKPMGATLIGPIGQLGPTGPNIQVGIQGHTGTTGISNIQSVCPYCGQRYAKDETYCTHCGAQRE